MNPESFHLTFGVYIKRSLVRDFYLFDFHFAAAEEVGVFAAAAGAGFPMLDGAVLFPAVLTTGDCGDGTDFQLAAFEQGLLVRRPAPAIRQILRHDG